MPSSANSLVRINLFYLVATVILFNLNPKFTLAQTPRGPMAPPPPDDSSQQQPSSQAQDEQPVAQHEQMPPKAAFDPSIFLNPVPPDQLLFLKNYANSASGDLARDKDFHKLLKTVVPDCMFHYGRDMPLLDALEMVLKDSMLPVEIRDGRYVTVAGRSGPYLSGKGFVWFDMKTGIALGGFYFHPTNGEPTPTLCVFSKQVKEKYLEMSQLPEAFEDEANQWSQDNRVPPVLTRYFLTGGNKRVLLAHDEDYCSVEDTVPDPQSRDCEQMNADAADTDMNAAYYLEQTHNATNATEWMALGEDQIGFLHVRDTTCGGLADPLGCRIRMAHDRTRVILTREPVPHPAPRR
jgi:uncharacterized protein YecT (DUF1311 family)